MRQVTKNLIRAFVEGRNYKESNTQIIVAMGMVKMLLFGKLIAMYVQEKGIETLQITNAGWPTDTTKERLNGIPGVNINQKNFTWYLNNKQWDGEWISINN